MTDIFTKLYDAVVEDSFIPDAVESINGEVISRNVIHKSRWTVIMETIVKVDDKFFSLIEYALTTEYQEGQDSTIEITEVEQVPVQTFAYRKIEGGRSASIDVGT